MKFILSIFMLPALLSGILTGIFGLFYYSCAGLPLAQEYTFGGHLLAAFLYLAIGLGLPLAVFSVLSGVLLTVAGFVLRAWIRMLFAVGITATGIATWIYMVNLEMLY